MLVSGGIDDHTKDDTWRFDGQRWARAATTAQPSARYGHRAVFDVARGRTVLFGGYDGGYQNDTWIWDGSAWFRLQPAVSPGGRYLAGLAWDVARGVAVLFGGRTSSNYSDTWEWDGNAWRQVASNSPGGRYGHAMTYDPDLRRTLMFGGYSSATLQDTWSFDGTTWRQESPPAQPSRRYHAAMVHDPLRHRVVLYGGFSGTASLDDTWEWDGASRSWAQASVSGPGLRHGHTVVFDPRRGKVVLFGGERYPAPGISLSDVWEWDGSSWTKARDTLPTGRFSPRMQFDPAADLVLLFGGGVNTSNSVALSDTWTYDGTTWTEARPATNPMGRWYHDLAHDPVRRRTVLFGGYSGSANLNDTWEWIGIGWQQVSPAGAMPSARYGHAMAFHAGMNEVVLFGGYDGAAKNDTWSWNGVRWLQQTTGGAPPQARYYHVLAYDPQLDRLVLFGGYNGSSRVGDTWTWTAGAGWVACNCGGVTPPARAHSRMVYDPTRDAVVLFSGSNTTYYSDTWELRGSTWTKCTQLQEPPVRDNHAMVYDSRRQRLLAFGGWLRGSDFWECSNPNPATFVLEPGATGCALGGRIPNLEAENLAWRGESLRVAIDPLPTTGLVTPLLLVGFPPSVALPIPQFPPCQLHVLPIVLQLPMLATTPGRAVATLPIPDNWRWLGAELLVQAAALQAVPLQLGMTPAARARIGARHP